MYFVFYNNVNDVVNEDVLIPAVGECLLQVTLAAQTICNYAKSLSANSIP